jgi:Raf kinase inhibitor-like YbhB/YbcL family protein
MLGTLWRKLSASFSRRRRPKGKPSRPGRFLPTVEALQDRTLPSGFSLTSPDFQNGHPIPREFAAGPELPDGRRTHPNKSPALEFHNVPLGTRSFALIMYDQDVVLEGGNHFVHWVIFNIPGFARSLPEGIARRLDLSPLQERQGLNGNDEPGYLGPNPQPPPHTHTYVFRLYALNERLTLPESVKWGNVRGAMDRPGVVILGRSVLEGTFTVGT